MWPVFMKKSPTSWGVATLRSLQGFCVTKMVAALLRKPPPRKSKPVNATTSRLFGIGRDRLVHFRDHLVGALQGRPVGQDHRRDVEALVLVGHQAPRRDVPQPGRGRDHAGEEREADAAAPDDPRHARLVVVGGAAEARVEPAKNPAAFSRFPASGR
jgi:hypothetical protein